MASDEPKMMHVMTACRKSFATYFGAVATMPISLTVQDYIISRDIERLRERYLWCEQNCSKRYWLLWSPRTTQEDIVHDAMVVFEAESDAALYLLSFNEGFMRLGEAAKGVIAYAKHL